MEVRTENPIQIDVTSAYIEEQSSPEKDRYVFAYTIRVKNLGASPAQLLNRHWVITDANGKIEEVRGEGVVGKQPRLNPGEQFEYTSGAILETPVGTMEGEYGMITDDGEHFDAPIAVFSLAIPNIYH